MNREAEPFKVRTTAMWEDDNSGIRSLSEGDGMTLTGYVAVFGRMSKPLRFPNLNRGKPFREVIEPGAFNRTLSNGRDVALLWQHDPFQLPLGSTKAGTMSLVPDAVGLGIRAALPDNEHGRPFRDAVARRDVTGMSFRMQQSVDNARADGTFPIETLPDGTSAHVRRIREVKLMPEVSITNTPAYEDAVATIRSIAEDVGVDADELEAAMSAFESGALTIRQRDIITEAATKRAAAAIVCCDACGDAAPGCCGTDSRCPEGCDGADCAMCSCGPSTAPGSGDGMAAMRSEPDPAKLAEMRRRLDALR